METIMEICPICNRPIPEGTQSKHHLIPSTFKGKETVTLHHICHDFIHSVVTEREMKNYYHTIERLLERREVIKFSKWVSKKDPHFYEKSKDTKRRKGKRR